MNIDEIRKSGMLEHYAMGVLSEQEVREVEGYLNQYPALQQDYLEIQNALQALATEKSIKPRASLEDELIKSIMDQSKTIDGGVDSDKLKNDNISSSNIWKTIAALLAISAISAVYFFWNMNAKYKNQTREFDTYKLECDSIKREQQEKIDLFSQLNVKDNRILNMTPTEGYPETQLLFHFNPIQKVNYIQIQNLPSIASNQAFQLWSLKPGEDPIPLTVFKNSADFVIPVDFEDGTGTYAITIEDENGALSPTLERLIGTVGV